MNTTNSTLNTTALNKDYYDRQLLEGAKTRFVFTKYGQKRTVPLNNGKHVEFRRWNLFDVDDNMCALEEGKTPEGQSLSQSSVEATLAQYGAYVEVSDMLEDTAYDKVLSDSAELLGEQIGTVMEWVTRDAVCGGTNVQYVGGKTARNQIDSTDTLTVNEIRKAVRTLKKAKARPFADDGRRPHYICICSPDAVYDLQNDSLWQDVSKYSGAENIYSGEIGRLFGVVFVESTEAKVIRQAMLTKLVSHEAGSDTFTVTGTEVEVAFVPSKLPVWALCAGGAALLVLLLLLAKRIRSKRGPKGGKPEKKKAPRKEKKGRKAAVDASAPADELDTPISETDVP